MAHINLDNEFPGIPRRRKLPHAQTIAVTAATTGAVAN
jgi:hypothetical protein